MQRSRHVDTHHLTDDRDQLDTRALELACTVSLPTSDPCDASNRSTHYLFTARGKSRNRLFGARAKGRRWRRCRRPQRPCHGPTSNLPTRLWLPTMLSAAGCRPMTSLALQTLTTRSMPWHPMIRWVRRKRKRKGVTSSSTCLLQMPPLLLALPSTAPCRLSCRQTSKPSRIGFQGHHARLKLRCGKFKRAGDGFQVCSHTHSTHTGQVANAPDTFDRARLSLRTLGRVPRWCALRRREIGLWSHVEWPQNTFCTPHCSHISHAQGYFS